MSRERLTLPGRESLTHCELLKHFKYHPTTGEFVRILGYDSHCNPVECYKPVKGKNNRGYLWVRFKNTTFLVHRLVHLYMTKKHPLGEIDHIDGNRLNNNWSNLRDVDPFENARNQGNRRDNTSGCRGVTYYRPKRGRNKWLARISHRGVRHCLGYFLTKEEAIVARKRAEIYFKYHRNHGSRESWRK